MAAIYLALCLICVQVQAAVGTRGIQENTEIGLGDELPTEQSLSPDKRPKVVSSPAKQGHCSYTFTVPTSDQPNQPYQVLESVQKEVAALNDWKYQVSTAVSGMKDRIDQVAKWMDGLDKKVEKSDYKDTIEDVAALHKQQEETMDSLKALTLYVQSLYNTLNMLMAEKFKQQDIYKLGTVNTKDLGKYPKDCADLYQEGYSESGVYMVQPDVSYIIPRPTAPPDPFPVYCIMKNNTGWTVVQRRADGFTNFNQDWQHYKHGFGHLNREFWLGNEKIYFLTNQKRYKLRVEMEDWREETAYAEYDQFLIEDESERYRLGLGGYSGTAGNALVNKVHSYLSHHNRPFQTRRNDCAEDRRGGWWYFTYSRGCQEANLNGQYTGDNGYHRGFDYGIVWGTWRSEDYSLKAVRMMIAPATD